MYRTGWVVQPLYEALGPGFTVEHVGEGPSPDGDGATMFLLRVHQVSSNREKYVCQTLTDPEPVPEVRELFVEDLKQQILVHFEG